ncbi:hypothetical protein Voc01_087020 [Virgisporangium ochraceum]|uniref:Uncharacterized protein n=1 Tax=Virgisporangium ochraceum TaxID=65505 RepID=A0A8J4A4M2_9ACTN|nr:hypothetical protein Voc01_087020 [Virgisporangium ochraceum]
MDSPQTVRLNGSRPTSRPNAATYHWLRTIEVMGVSVGAVTTRRKRHFRLAEMFRRARP